MLSLSFGHLNLRRNPFGEFSADEQAQLARVDIEQAIVHLTQPRATLQVLGDKGFGKTTHLMALRTRFPQSAYVHLPESKPVQLPSSGEPLLVDEAQRLTGKQRRQLFASQRTLILGTHHDFTDVLRRSGREVLSIAAGRHTDAERVHRLLNARIEFCRRGVGPVPQISRATAAELFRQFGADLRSIQFSLYDSFRQLKEVQDVQVRSLD